MAGTAVMKLRSFLLIVCMAVVPLVAMFSHKIPREWRLAAQRLARGEGFAGIERVARGDELVPVEEPAQAEGQGAPLVATPPPPSPAPSHVAAIATPSSPRAFDDVVRVRAEIEHQLTALGAVSFACAQTTAGSLHRCSCRVSADPSGQLQRVFQSSHPDEVVALKNLLGQVQFWKHRLAALPESGVRPDGVPPARR